MSSLQTNDEARSLSRAIAERALALRATDVPSDVWRYLKLCLADAIGIAFASRDYDFAHKSLASFGRSREPGQRDDTGSVGHGRLCEMRR
jgi:2-methylcitrate dehydratase PrpD